MNLEEFRKTWTKVEYRYFRNTKSGSIYRTAPIQLNTGEMSESLERFNWDRGNWNGHIHDHEKTRKDIEEFNNVVETTKNDIDKIINSYTY